MEGIFRLSSFYLFISYFVFVGLGVTSSFRLLPNRSSVSDSTPAIPF